jgi:hypothetical protein
MKIIDIDEEEEEKEEIPVCSQCHIWPAIPEEPCPYALDVNGEEVLCDCCQYCRDECAMDI